MYFRNEPPLYSYWISSSLGRISFLCMLVIILPWWLISLHIRSMWETICDAWACWSGWNFGPNSTVYPYSVEYPPPPPPPTKNENCQSPSLSTEYPPLKWKIVRESKSEYRIPPQKWKLSESPSTEYPPKKWKLSESPSPSTEQNTPPSKMKIVRV